MSTLWSGTPVKYVNTAQIFDALQLYTLIYDFLVLEFKDVLAHLSFATLSCKILLHKYKIQLTGLNF